jgi:hypothetical protein
MRALRRKPVKAERLSYAAIAVKLNAEGIRRALRPPVDAHGVCKALAHVGSIE